MKSVRFNDSDNERFSVASVDEILNKGCLSDFLDFLSTLIEAPNGEAAKNMERLFHGVNFDDPDFHATEQFLAAYHLVMALRQFAPHHKP